MTQIQEISDSSITQIQKPAIPVNKRGEGFYFAGFKSPNYTPIPDEFFDMLAPRLSEAELRVLLYIMRRTFGFKKQADAISLSQLTGGIRKRNGEVLDGGTGLSKPAALKGVAGLQEKGIIIVEKAVAEDGRNEINVYRLRYATDLASEACNSNFSQPNSYSTVEHSSKKQTAVTPPKLQPDNVPSSVALPETEKQQRGVQSEEPPGVKQIEQNKLKATKPEDGVKQLYYQGKAALPHQALSEHGGKVILPMPAKNTKRGKLDLPSRVKEVDQGSNLAKVEGVNLVDPQYNSLPKNIYQKTAINNNAPTRHSGNLAMQHQPQEEVVVDINKNSLLEQETEEIKRLLLSYGLNDKAASELANNWSSSYIRQKIRLVEDLRRRNPQAVRNLAGLIRQAITDNYGPGQGIERNTRTSNSRYRRVSGPGLDPERISRLSVNQNVESSEVAGIELAIEETCLVGSSFREEPTRYSEPDCGLLWEKVCQAIGERYRRPDLAAKLVASSLTIKSDIRKARISLAQPWLINSLLSAEQALMQMAFSQEFEPGYKLEISS